MCRAILKGLIVVVALSSAGTLQAGPMAFWDQPWQVSFTTPEPEGSVVKLASNFGKSATADGQKLNLGSAGEPLPGTSAFARAVAWVKSGLIDNSDALATVFFERDFRLQDSPNGWGWDVSLSGTLDGLLAISRVQSMNPFAKVHANAFIEREFPLPTAFLDFQTRLTYFGVNYTYNVPSTSTVSLEDGFYTAKGSLEVSASIESSLFKGDSRSNFFDGSGGFELTVTATPRTRPIPKPAEPPPPLLASSGPTSQLPISQELPVPAPEPGSLTLLAIGTLGLLGYGRRRKRAAA